jgi:hypothetical protein
MCGSSRSLRVAGRAGQCSCSSVNTVSSCPTHPDVFRALGAPTGCPAIPDANGQSLAYVYSRDNDAEARQAKVLTGDEARRIAVNIARLPGLLGEGETQQS